MQFGRFASTSTLLLKYFISAFADKTAQTNTPLRSHVMRLWTADIRGERPCSKILTSKMLQIPSLCQHKHDTSGKFHTDVA